MEVRILTNKKDDLLLTPGTISPISGQGIEVGPRGGRPCETEVTLVKGKKVPPTSASGRKIRIVDETKHKNK